MPEIIPAIIAKDFQEFQEKIRKIEPYVDWVQLDIMDGRFVENTTWREPKELKNLKTNLKLEAHLMIERPEETIDDWIVSGVKRIIFHYEATDKKEEVIERIKKAGLEVGLAVNPETPAEVINDLISQVNLILVMSVFSGSGGQRFLEGTLGKIRKLKEKYQNIKIEVDGGINLETAKKAVEAGVDILVSGSYIFESQDIKQAIKNLRRIYASK